MAKKRKPYVFYDTIWNSVGGGFSYSGQTKLYNVGKYKVVLTRAERLNKYGNPIHTATVLNKDGTGVSSYKSTGSATLVVSGALKKAGVETKYKKRRSKK